MFFYLIPEQTLKRLDGESHWSYLKRLTLRRKKQLPSGGVKVIYQHCDILNRNGIEAYPVHLGDFIVDWFPHQSQPISIDKAKTLMKDSDVLICPEIIPGMADKFKCSNKIVFIQNWALVDIGTGNEKRYEDFGFTELTACSLYIKNYMQKKSSLPCTVIINGIDTNKFKVDETNRVKDRVLYLNRRNVADARSAITMLPSELKNKTEFIELENRYKQDELIKYYQKADVFMSIGYPEGFALPPLEAMACGCAVIGFTGGGGLEHMIDNQTALVAPDADTTKLSECLKQILTNEEMKESIRICGQKKSREFSLKNMEYDLMTFVKKF